MSRHLIWVPIFKYDALSLKSRELFYTTEAKKQKGISIISVPRNKELLKLSIILEMIE